eukprot:CAMPEP_0185561498 /NCGR_PEP_ID=MMETSP1381-20130426/59283_1 /TAXON_ID=298111 /ORGANISM="Pavlova sp., Strain CCMP459" /LENGTH=137 /DNA_ID=CAMNT_0028175267 /DNA_START=37 /DNA_END=447 /DNA_ORIENTATION=-
MSRLRLARVPAPSACAQRGSLGELRRAPALFGDTPSTASFLVLERCAHGLFQVGIHVMEPLELPSREAHSSLEARCLECLCVLAPLSFDLCAQQVELCAYVWRVAHVHVGVCGALQAAKNRARAVEGYTLAHVAKQG